MEKKNNNRHTVKRVLNESLKNRQNEGLKDRWQLNAGRKY